MSLSRDQFTLLRVLVERSKVSTQRCYLVGGVLRDLFLLNSLLDRDVDILVDGSAGEEASFIAERFGGSVRTFNKFLTAKAEKLTGFERLNEVDFASARKEKYPAPGSLPQVLPASVSEDLARRDFSINAMAVEISTALVQGLESGDFLNQPHSYGFMDSFGGLKDLREKVLRILHQESFRDDPTRILRGIRYCARLNGAFDGETEQSLREAIASGVFGSISTQRFFADLKRILKEPTVRSALGLLSRYSCRNGTLLVNVVLSDEMLAIAGEISQGLEPEVQLEVFRLALEVLSKGLIPDEEWFAFGMNRKGLGRLRAEALAIAGLAGGVHELEAAVKKYPKK
ncbi:MAG: CCA tRNA nucleotidyltransferase [Bdellovibrionales bacterium]|nr:CCA tRNA nucleotidyltransferase [Bdellovibrionales bacterium]